MPFPIGTKMNGQILRGHLTLFSKANRRLKIENFRLKRKSKKRARYYKLFFVEKFIKSVLFSKINISQNILIKRAKKIWSIVKKKYSIGSKIRLEKITKNRGESTVRNIIRKKPWRKIERRQRMDKRIWIKIIRVSLRMRFKRRRISFRFASVRFGSVRSFLADSQSASCVVARMYCTMMWSFVWITDTDHTRDLLSRNYMV